MDTNQETNRLNDLKSFNILDTIEEQDFDNLTAISSEICNTPIALISLIDEKRQWFKSHHGLGARETPREHAFCAHAIKTPNEPFIVNNSLEDDRFKNNPLVTGEPKVIFYTGIPLLSDEGNALGTLCVIDHKPKELTEKQMNALNALANQVMKLLNLRKTKIQLEQTYLEIEQHHEQLKIFTEKAAHDVKSPLSEISGFVNVYKRSQEGNMDERSVELFNSIEDSISKLKQMMTELVKQTT